MTQPMYGNAAFRLSFALSLLSIVRNHIPGSLLAFLVGLAIVDVVGAIAVIPLFYADDVSILYSAKSSILDASLLSAMFGVLYLGFIAANKMDSEAA